MRSGSSGESANKPNAEQDVDGQPLPAPLSAESCVTSPFTPVSTSAPAGSGACAWTFWQENGIAPNLYFSNRARNGDWGCILGDLGGTWRRISAFFGEYDFRDLRGTALWLRSLNCCEWHSLSEQKNDDEGGCPHHSRPSLDIWIRPYDLDSGNGKRMTHRNDPLHKTEEARTPKIGSGDSPAPIRC